jgi:hypothetical protein
MSHQGSDQSKPKGDYEIGILQKLAYWGSIPLRSRGDWVPPIQMCPMYAYVTNRVSILLLPKARRKGRVFSLW